MTPLELFFDLVFVLAITQCTALMSHHPTWSGLAQGLLVLGMLWWAWTGYSWLTSVIDPEEGAVRLVIFGAMAALLLVSLCVPEAFGDLALAFALIYGVVRTAQIALFMLASPEDDALRHSVLGLAASTAVAVVLLATASLFDGLAQGALWALALFLDMARALLLRLRRLETGSRPLRRAPRADRDHRPRRVDRRDRRRRLPLAHPRRSATAAVLGVALTAAMWWIYFDIVAIVAGAASPRPRPGKVQNEMARDSYSYMHLVMVAGIVLVALGLKTTIGHFDDHLRHGARLRPARRPRHLPARPRRLPLPPRPHDQPAAPAARRSSCCSWSRWRPRSPPSSPLAIANLLIWAMIAYETRIYGEGRQQVRRPQTEPA